mmetsp:Transcript_10952/g.23698  ORF Transcript_10952/g.23698 Transcript_10952/m.23698 type:complete len:883 (+) Transcript_10952:124-2772(+)
MTRSKRSRKSTAASSAPAVEEEEAAPTQDVSTNDDAAAGDTEKQKESETIQSLSNLLSTLSKPEDLLTSILFPSSSGNADGGISTSSEELSNMLRSVSKTLFARLEELATFEERIKNRPRTGSRDNKDHYAEIENDNDGDEDDAANDCPLSGLAELYTGDRADDDDDDVDEQAASMAADAETVWGQVDLQNEALLPMLRKSVRSLSKKITKEGASSLRLLDFGDLTDEDDVGDAASTSGSEGPSGDDHVDISAASDNEEEDEEDEDARRIRERMDKAMEDMDGDMDDDEDDDGIDDARAKASNRTGGGADDDDEQLEDPAADDLNDGFFDINEMERFADEEEDYLPDDIAAVAEKERKEKNTKTKLPHQRQREGEESSDSEAESDLEEPTVVKRKKYREDDEIDALYSLYQEADEGGDEEDDVVNWTAADFFGRPNKRYLRAKKGQDAGPKGNSSKGTPKSKVSMEVIGEDVDSWDEHSFGDDDEVGPDWRDDSPYEREKGVAEDSNSEHDEELSIGMEDDGSDEEGMEGSHEDEQKQPESQSKHAIESAKLLKQTEELEKEALSEKPWQMKGESKGTERPTNSLLDSTPEFEVANKMAPIITVEHTASIEDMIKKRIIDEDWDDVVPRELPDVGLGKRKGELPEVSQEKSKLGLGELYEREYLKKVAGYDKDAVERESEEDKVKSEMKALFADLCSKLDALSNYHFAPRPVADEAEVRTVTTPAIAMEEALPLHVSDARGVAPEEIYGSKEGRESVIRGESEMDQTERRRLRNAKKAARRKARKAKLADEKLISRLQPGLGLNNPYEKRKLREELQMARASGKVTAGEIDANKDYTTSTKFFQRMQENVEQEVRGDGASQGRKRKRNNQGSEGRKSSSYKL